MVEAGCIENMYFDPVSGREGKKPIPEMMYAYFGKENVFFYEADAWGLAEQMEDACVLVEYGVSVLNHSEMIFPAHLTDADVKEYDRRTDEAMEARKVREEKLREERREASLVLLLDSPATTGLRAENGGTFTPNRVYGHLEKDGEKIHGSLETNEEGRAYFLPSTWNEER